MCDELNRSSSEVAMDASAPHEEVVQPSPVLDYCSEKWVQLCRDPEDGYYLTIKGPYRNSPAEAAEAFYDADDPLLRFVVAKAEAAVALQRTEPGVERSYDLSGAAAELGSLWVSHFSMLRYGVLHSCDFQWLLPGLQPVDQLEHIYVVAGISVPGPISEQLAELKRRLKEEKIARVLAEAGPASDGAASGAPAAWVMILWAEDPGPGTQHRLWDQGDDIFQWTSPHGHGPD